MSTIVLVLFLSFTPVLAVVVLGQQVNSLEMALQQESTWYSSTEAVRIADNLAGRFA